jgi:hypothetical protein
LNKKFAAIIEINNIITQPKKENVYMDEFRTDDIPQVNNEENNLFTDLYSEEKVRNTIF